MEFFGKNSTFQIFIMNKYILLISVFLVSSCSFNSNSDSVDSTKLSEVDWSNVNSCKTYEVPGFIDELINKMTLEQKVGQIIMPDIDEVSPDEAKEYHLGTLLNGGGKFPNNGAYFMGHRCSSWS